MSLEIWEGGLVRKQEITGATPFIICSRKDLPTPLHPAPLHTKSCALGLLSFNRKLNFYRCAGTLYVRSRSRQGSCEGAGPYVSDRGDKANFTEDSHGPTSREPEITMKSEGSAPVVIESADS